MRFSLFSLATVLLVFGCGRKNNNITTDPGTIDTDTQVSVGGTDNDGDGLSGPDGDCDDNDANARPGLVEICDGIDNDCNGTIDDNALDAIEWYFDFDQDGYGDPFVSEISCEASSGYVLDNSDCDDESAIANPAGLEVCGDSIDNDCVDGVDDAGATDAQPWYNDTDLDGFGNPNDALVACEMPSGYVADNTDCNDLSMYINSTATELCDGVDENCDGLIDNDAYDSLMWYADADLDGFGDALVPLEACEQPPGHVADNTDCDDLQPLSRPGLAEVCDGLDNDCDTVVDNDDAVDAQTWYNDSDADGYGDPTDSLTSCAQPTTYVADNTDCNDADPARNPGTVWYADADGDGFGAGVGLPACGQPSGFVAASGDCDDTDEYAFPGAVELCDERPNDCDTALTWAPTDEDDTASWVAEDGTWSDSSFAAGTPINPVAATFDSHGTLWMCDGTYYVNLTLERDIAVIGRNGSAMTVLDGALSGSVITRTGGSRTVDLRGLTLTAGSALEGGGIHTTGGFLNLTDVQVINNVAAVDGGGIYLSNTDMTTTSTVISGNTAGDGGGGLRGMGVAIVTLTDSEISSNNANGQGGAGRTDPAIDILLDNVLVDGNTAAAGGGGFRSTGTLTLIGSMFSDNQVSAGSGGAVNFNTGVFDATDTVFADNGASDRGGAIYASGGALTVTDSTVVANSADFGGGFAGQGATFTLDTVDVFNNDAPSGGGAVHLNGMPLISTDSVLQGNTSSVGGAIFLTNAATVDITGGEIVGNSATDQGGALANGAGTETVTLDSVVVAWNSAGDQGGALKQIGASTFSITDCVFNDNVAIGNGGAVSGTSSGAVLTIASTEFMDNFSGGFGGALFVQNATVTSSDFTANLAEDTVNAVTGGADTWGLAASFVCDLNGCI